MITQRAADAVKPYVGRRLRKRVVQVRFAARRPTATQRLLPDFLLIGAMRGGTSSLYKYLSQHPEVAPSLRKEVEYFTHNFERGEGWYRQHFALAGRRWLAERRGDRLQAFEATPYYLYDPRCPRRAHALLPDTRLVAVLRDPVERAFSHYEHMLRLGFEPLSFEAAVEAEQSRIGSEVERIMAEPEYRSKTHHRFSYLDRGRYADQLARWLDLYPREQLLIVESADLYASPMETFQDIQDYLGLSTWYPAEYRNYSYVGRPPVRLRVDPGLRRELRARLVEDDARLAKLWGRTPSWRQEP